MRSRRLVSRLLVLLGLAAQSVFVSAAVDPFAAARAGQQGGATTGTAVVGEPRFLPADEAFQFSAVVRPAPLTPATIEQPPLDDRSPEAADASGTTLSTPEPTLATVVATWRMPPGYYLYRHAFAVTVRGADPAQPAPVLGDPEIPAGLPKQDDYFGAVEVYYDAAELRVPVRAGVGAFEVGITWQGCADAGLCYPPETRWVPVVLPGGTGNAGSTASSYGADGRPDQAVTGGTAAVVEVGGDASSQSEDRRLAGLLADTGLVTSLLLFFVAGLGLAFTPCVLPMVPILSSIIVGEAGPLTTRRAFGLSLAYVLGMASTYALVGVLVGLFGAGLNLQAALQSPAVLVTFAFLFVLLALAMFGVYELQLPARWRDGLNALGDRVGGGRHASVLVMGAFSALVVSPCVSAPLAGALIYLSTTGDALLGGSALLALGLGMGTPLLVIGASGGHLLPRAGGWMMAVKAVFGVGLLAVAVWLLERVVPAPVVLGLWGALAIGTGIYMGAIDLAPRTGWLQLWRAVGVMLLVWGVLLLIGAAGGADDPLRPLARTQSSGQEIGTTQAVAQWRTTRGLEGVRSELAAAAAAGEPVLLDFYADWCISCKIMERNVFPVPEVVGLLAGFRLLRVDVTDNTPSDRALLDSLGLFGPPSLVFYDAEGSELDEHRLQGELDAAGMAAHLRRVRISLDG